MNENNPMNQRSSTPAKMLRAFAADEQGVGVVEIILILVVNRALFYVYVYSVLCRKRTEKWLYFNTIQSFL